MTVNLLVVGVGPHTRLNHLPSLAAGQDSGLVGTVTGIDLPAVAQQPVTYGLPGSPRLLPMVGVEPLPTSWQILPAAVRSVLDAVVIRERIRAVIVATEPSVHMPYALWALERGLSVLLDKPLSVHAGASVDPESARAIAEDFDTLMDAYRKASLCEPAVVVSVMSQRRWHPAFQRMRDLIAEVAQETNCPVTNIQSSHGDGQWRLPDELVNLGYHGFDRGYGKAAHSGYHEFDIVPWLLDAGERPGKELDEVEVHAHVARPADTLAQLTVADHERLFPDFAKRNPFGHTELQKLTGAFGEVDAFLSMAYRSGGRTMTLGSINLAHHTFSQRGSLEPALVGLYKGNGRIGQETHIIQQGPFQALHFHCLQTLHDDEPGIDPAAVGGADHVTVHVFRNNRLRPDWKRHTTLDFADLTQGAGPGAELPTQRSSRNRAVTEFLHYLTGRIPRQHMVSDLVTHRRPAQLMAGAYLSMAHRFTSTGPAPVRLGFRSAPTGTEDYLVPLEAAR
ncbi:Gfo/Idh/MocA family oxidoreductase [Streptomyces sp. ISL-98]|uniref:Gfo/Idh/MocA family protein n=1 Tax=Streptomyces sp. ISL-98 TaxID=2819192 RepID=UPI001BE55555|nr:Gfo/Idh/MocA family oxidoreductase [Streptomyces sp. ISL-98]MBT2507000.1 Gfo/Idh/MocA family oxidoreductase [Streptomyces sp. ISL-98]